MKKKTIIISILLLVLMTSSVSALGMGIIKYNNYGDVNRGNTYSLEISVFPFDSRYEPYTEIPLPEDYKAEVKIRTNDINLVFEEYHTLEWNQHNKIQVTLEVPKSMKNIKYQYYENQICASFYQYGMNSGACGVVQYTITKNKMKK